MRTLIFLLGNFLSLSKIEISVFPETPYWLACQIYKIQIQFLVHTKVSFRNLNRLQDVAAHFLKPPVLDLEIISSDLSGRDKLFNFEPIVIFKCQYWYAWIFRVVQISRFLNRSSE